MSILVYIKPSSGKEDGAMRAIFLVLLLAGALSGQTTVIIRSALADANFNRNSLYSEFVQQRGKNVLADCGYQDAGSPRKYFAVFCGGGRDLSPRPKRFNLIAELVAMRSFGQSTMAQYHLLPYILIHTSLGKKGDIELVGYSGLPLNTAARKFMEIERLRLYHNFGRGFKAGFGYAGAKSASYPPTHKPFIGVAFRGVEIWPQALISNGKWGWQLQLRFAKTFR